MWLLPVLHLVSTAIARTYYRLTVSGPPIPAGPVLIVANHPNGLLDPVLVAAAARRPVRLLAKAPLVEDPWIGWLIRAGGAIPVHRPADDPSRASLNTKTFDAVARALAAGGAIGIFPEGRSHSEPALVRLRTGAARMVLACTRQTGVRPVIVPIGLVFRRKAIFRSRALALVGPAIDWSDLAGREPDGRMEVEALTARIDAGLRTVTVNTERWADLPLIECAEAIWTAHWGSGPDPHSRVGRLHTAASLLASARRLRHAEAQALALDVTAHCARLRRLGLVPASLGLDTRARTAVAWALRRWYLVLAPTVALAMTAGLVFALPYHLTAAVAARLPDDEDVRSTYKVLTGVVVHGGWVGLLVVGMTWALGWRAGAATLVSLPVLAGTGLWAWERCSDAWRDARRFLTVRHSQRIAALRADQAALAARLEALSDAMAESTMPD